MAEGGPIVTEKMPVNFTEPPWSRRHIIRDIRVVSRFGVSSGTAVLAFAYRTASLILYLLLMQTSSGPPQHVSDNLVLLNTPNNSTFRKN